MTSLRRSGSPDEQTCLEAIRTEARPLRGTPSDYDRILEQAADARVVLLGEATHGTHEFYRARAEITRRLIEEKGFDAVAAEADWPDAYRVNRFVRGSGPDPIATTALEDFQRFPNWMWRNADVLEFVGWLRDHNQALPPERRAGFYGLDLYSLRSSTEAVIRYLDRVDPGAARDARRRYGCLEQVGGEAQHYGYAVALGVQPSCENEVVEQLLELRQQAGDYLERDGLAAEDEQFCAEQNAKVARDAEAYYRSMFDPRANTWNMRDRHMDQTLGALGDHLTRSGRAGRIVVWAHNSHVGDARATDMSRRGELNVGQLARERYGDGCLLVGFSTYEGTVSAASEWDGPVYRKRVRPALPESFEALFHRAETGDFLLPLRTGEAGAALRDARLQRAIGVLYLPETERASHYFHCRIPEQFDVVLHFERTRAVQPLEPTPEWSREEAADTYPYGL